MTARVIHMLHRFVLFGISFACLTLIGSCQRGPTEELILNHIRGQLMTAEPIIFLDTNNDYCLSLPEAAGNLQQRDIGFKNYLNGLASAGLIKLEFRKPGDEKCRVMAGPYRDSFRPVRVTLTQRGMEESKTWEETWRGHWVIRLGEAKVIGVKSTTVRKDRGADGGYAADVEFRWSFHASSTGKILGYQSSERIGCAQFSFGKTEWVSLGKNEWHLQRGVDWHCKDTSGTP